MDKNGDTFPNTSRSVYFSLTAFAAFMPMRYATTTYLPVSTRGIDVSSSMSTNVYYKKNSSAKALNNFAINFPSQKIKLKIIETKKYQINCDALDDVIG